MVVEKRKPEITKEIKPMYNLKWINKYSQETGYVKKVLKSKGHFENTFEQTEAKKYRSKSAALKDIDILASLGEAENNNFELSEF